MFSPIDSKVLLEKVSLCSDGGGERLDLDPLELAPFRPVPTKENFDIVFDRG